MATRPTRTGRDVLLEVLRSQGVRHLFGNPGTTELPLIDALATAEDIAYVLGLQEASVVGMADGYAQVTSRPAVVNLHTSAGLGNAIGNLTNARANQAPLVVTAGNQDRRHLVADPLLGGDLVGLAGPVTRWAHEVSRLGDLGTVLRRAFSDSLAPPPGPVFVSLPMDLLDEAGEVDVPPLSTVDRRTVPAAVEELADLLAATPVGRLAVVAGDEVAASGAVAVLGEVAETLGCPVHGAPLHSNVVLAATSPLWRGALPPSAAGIREVLSGYDRVLLVGGRAFMVYPYTPGSPVPDGVELLHLSPDPTQLGRSHPVRLGLVGDPRATLEALLPRLRARVDAGAAADAVAAARARRDADVASLEEAARSRYSSAPMDPMAAVHAVLRALPPDPLVVDEAITTGAYVRRLHRPSRPGRYLFCRGGGLGWGIPAAVGAALAAQEAVVCVVGDGSALYSPQALWTAAREGLPVLVVVVNNRQYLILKRNLAPDSASVRRGRYVGLDLDHPPVDFVALARSFGVPATLVEKAPDVGDAVQAALGAGGPHLLELPIAA